MSDLGPFAIRRIESGTSSPAAPGVAMPPADQPATTVLERAAEAFADRVSGKVARNSPIDTQIAETIRTQSASMDAETLTPLLGALSGPPALAPQPAKHDPLAPGTIDPSRDSNGPSIDPSADAMRTSVFHPLANLTSAPGAAAPAAPAAAAAPAHHPSDDFAGRLQPLLDQFLPVTGKPGT